MFAAGRCEPEIVAALLEAGAGVDLADENRNTALFLASGEGRADVVRILLAAGPGSKAMRWGIRRWFAPRPTAPAGRPECQRAIPSRQDKA